MKARKIFSRLVCFLLVFCTAFTISMFGLQASAKTNDNASKFSEPSPRASCCNEGSGTYVSLDTEKRHFAPNENILVQYSVSSGENIADFSYSQTGFAIISIQINEENDSTLSAELSCAATASNYQLTIPITLQSGNTLTASLYAIKNELGTFISPFSEDDARERFFDYAVASDIMSLEECSAIRNEFAKQCVVEEMSIEALSTFASGEAIEAATTESQETRVEGLLQWEDDDGIVHPLRGIMVEIYDEEIIGMRLLATVYTDNAGFYSYSFDNPDGLLDFENGGYDIIVRIYAGDENVMVKIGEGSVEYYCQFGVYNNVATGSTVNCSNTFSMSNDLGKAFQISQAALTARDYAWAMMGQKPTDVTVRYPLNINNCFYQSNCIRITANRGEDASFPTPYASWDVIMHEYGHHVQYIVGNADLLKLKHSSWKNDADVYGKDVGIRLAWAESWPTVFGLMAQQYYSNLLPNIDTVGDASYTAYNDLHYNIENNGAYLLGEACERSIMSVLWDLYDSNNDANDTISLGHVNFWAITTEDDPKTFWDFIADFYEQYPSYIDDIGLNLSYYQMATTKPYISNSSSVSQTVPPSFEWTAQGGSITYCNKSFNLIFYDASGAEIMRTASLTSPTYTLTQSEWNTVLYSYGTTYTVAVAAVQTDYPTTGAYISAQSITYTKPDPGHLPPQGFFVLPSDRYTERMANLQPGQYLQCDIYFESDGTRLIQTFGDKDTVMYLYDENEVLLDWDDNSGYETNALLSYDFSQGIMYAVRVYFFDENQFGEVKLAIVPSDPYATYEDVHGCNEDVVEYGTALSQEEVALLRYYTSETSTVTFTTQANFDAYLYVIDPRSTESISPSGGAPSTFDDESAGNMQARIIKTLDPGVPYLVILCAYDPSWDSGLCYVSFE